jgi:hypothetical protein
MYAGPERIDLARCFSPARSGLSDTMMDGPVRAEAVWFSAIATNPAVTAIAAAAAAIRTAVFLRFLGNDFLYLPRKSQLPNPSTMCCRSNQYVVEVATTPVARFASGEWRSCGPPRAGATPRVRLAQV